MFGAALVICLSSALQQKPTAALLAQKARAGLDPFCSEGVISLDMSACCQKDCGICADDSDVCKANLTNGRATTCCPSVVVEQGSCETSKAPCAVADYVKEKPTDLTSAEGVRNSGDDCGEAIADEDASIMVSTHYLEFKKKEPSKKPIHESAKGSAHSTKDCGSLGETLVTAASICNKEDDCMGFTASEGVPDCLLIAGSLVEGYKDSSKDTYLKRESMTGHLYFFNPPPFEDDSCSKECDGGVLNREMGCKLTSDITVKGGMCAHLAWMGKAAMPDEEIPCNTLPCAPPPKVGFIFVSDEQCTDQSGEALEGDRVYGCGAGLESYPVNVRQYAYGISGHLTTEFTFESAGGPCRGTYEGVQCQFVPGCYYNLNVGLNTGSQTTLDTKNGELVARRSYYSMRIYAQTESGSQAVFYFWKNSAGRQSNDARYGVTRQILASNKKCLYVRGPDEDKVDRTYQNVGEFYTGGLSTRAWYNRVPDDYTLEDGEGWKMSDTAIYWDSRMRKFLATNSTNGKVDMNMTDEEMTKLKRKLIPELKHPEQRNVSYNRAEKEFFETPLMQNGTDLRDVLKHGRAREEAFEEAYESALASVARKQKAKSSQKACGSKESKGLTLVPKK